ncbi:hypothetical protein V494_02156 [Pseudogymnoascus sp. VKM F-4513 (FW-928)]|nr:hypothetical protein V494_02156 [Pseudogymnoascus sp. VKM F-4513 (FW-928)]
MAPSKRTVTSHPPKPDCTTIQLVKHAERDLTYNEMHYRQTQINLRHQEIALEKSERDLRLQPWWDLSTVVSVGTMVFCAVCGFVFMGVIAYKDITGQRVPQPKRPAHFHFTFIFYRPSYAAPRSKISLSMGDMSASQSTQASASSTAIQPEDPHTTGGPGRLPRTPEETQPQQAQLEFDQNGVPPRTEWERVIENGIIRVLIVAFFGISGAAQTSSSTMVMPQSQSKSGPQSPPPSYSEAISTEPTSSHLQYDDAGFQCEHAPLGTYNNGIKSGQSAHGKEKCDCQDKFYTKEKEKPDIHQPKQEASEEGGKWEAKKEDMKRKWATTKGNIKQKWAKTKDDMKLKRDTKAKEDKTHAYAPLDEKVKGTENRRGSNVASGRKVKAKKEVRYTRAALSGESDTAILAGIASIALFATVFF